VYVWCGYSAESDWFKLPLLTLINLVCLLLNYAVEPCPVRSVNTMRTAALAGATWAGVSASSFLASDLLAKVSRIKVHQLTEMNTDYCLVDFFTWILTTRTPASLYSRKMTSRPKTRSSSCGC
jgi:hypothetical protein